MPAPRPRLGRNHRTYMPSDYQWWKESVRNLWPSGPRCWRDDARFAVYLGVRGHKRGDLDNYVKSVLDALSGTAFPDDSVRWVQELRVRWLGGGVGFDVSVTEF